MFPAGTGPREWNWVWFNIGNELREQDKIEEAVEAFGRAVAAGETDAHRNRAQLLEDLGQIEAAIDDYKRAGEAGDVAGFLDLAALLSDLGRREEARAALDRALASGDERAQRLAAEWQERGR